MATISKRTRVDGGASYTAQIRMFRNGVRCHTESMTFERRSDAQAWAKRREAELAGVTDFRALKTRGMTLSDAIDRYVSESAKAIGRTKAQVLRSIKSYDIASKPCDEIRSPDVVEFAQVLALERSPATVQNYLSHLSAIFAIAKPAWGIPLDATEMKAAMVVCARMGIAAKAQKRDRRPTIDEMNKIMVYFERRSAARPKAAPMHVICAFALFSTRRQSEVLSIRWDDLEVDAQRVLVRDMKHPGDKVGNDVWCELPDPAMRILGSVERKDERIFPYGADAVSAAFTRACPVLGIEDLRFHDLRHEGVSRLFEMGLTIPLAASVSGHRSWSSLQRYSHIRQVGDKWADWEWLSALS